MSLKADNEAILLIAAYIDKFAEDPPLADLRIGSLNEIKAILCLALKNNEPIKIPQAH